MEEAPKETVEIFIRSFGRVNQQTYFEKRKTMSKNTKKPNWAFNRDDESQGIFRQLAEGVSTRIFIGDKSMLSIVKIEPHSHGKIHSHPEEQWGVLLEGECVRIQDGEEIVMRIGDFWHTPGNVLHGMRTGSSSAAVLDIFSPPRPEYKQTGDGFGKSERR